MDSSRRADGRWARASTLALAAAGFAFLILPVAGLAGRVPWERWSEIGGDPLVREALRLSLITSVSAVLLALVFGGPMAWLLARGSLPGERFLRAAVTMPMVLPPVVAGVGLLAAFGRRGLLGPFLERFGISLPFTTTAAILAQTFVASPFLILQLEAGLRSIDPRYAAVAASLGASRLLVLRRILLPQLAPALGAGLAVSWARALGEFGATITFAGNLEGVTQTMPLAVYLAMEQNPEAAYLLAFILLGISFSVLFLLRGSLLGAARSVR